MKEWYSALELAGLPGLPGTEQGVNYRAKRENWQARKRAGRGGGQEYYRVSLPEATWEHLLSLEVAALLPPPVPSPPALSHEGEREPTNLPAVLAVKPAETPEQLPEWRRTTMYARLALIRYIETVAPIVGGVTKAIEQLVKQAANGMLPLEIQTSINQANARKRSPSSPALSHDGERELSSNLSISGVTKWWALYQKGQNPLNLAPKALPEKPLALWVPAFLACWRKGQNKALTDVLEELKTKLPAGIPMPTYYQATGYLKTLGTVERERGRMTGNALANIKPHRRRTTEEMLPGDCFTADGHCFDSEVAHPFHGRPFRPEITPVVDIFSRKIVGWSIDLAESGLAVLDALRMACELFGPPAIFYTDNGSGFKNQMMTEAGTGLLHWLGIHPEYSRPRNPKAHGVSERAHQSVLIRAAKELCTYIGADMDEDTKKLVYKKTRKALKEGAKSHLLIEWDDFVAHITAAVVRYNANPHKGLPSLRDPQTNKRTHLTPNQAWDMGMEQMKRTRPEKQWLIPANELPDLYHPKITRTVQRGEIQMGTKRNGYVKRYSSPDLAEFNRQKVFVAFSPSDPSKVWVRSMDDQRLLAVAKLDGNASEYFAPSLIDEKREQRGEARLKRLELKAEEARLEMHGPEKIPVAPAPYELPAETIATMAKVIELKRVKDATPSLEQELRDNQHQLHDDIQERQKRGEATEYECRWLEHYAMTDRGKRYGLYQKDPFCMDDPERQLRMTN